MLGDHRGTARGWRITLEVTGNDTIQRNTYNFLFMFNSNYGSLLHRFRDIPFQKNTVTLKSGSARGRLYAISYCGLSCRLAQIDCVTHFLCVCIRQFPFQSDSGEPSNKFTALRPNVMAVSLSFQQQWHTVLLQGL